MNSTARHTLWVKWVIANGLGEMLGLGLTFAIAVRVISSLGSQHAVTVILLSFLVAVGSGVIEATLVGLTQWWAMYEWLPSITRFAWWRAPLFGALIAYVMDYMPSTLMDLSEQTSQNPVTTAEPGMGLVLVLAAGLGVLDGAVLSFAQWRVMRKQVQGASIWIPANMLAWLVGMPIIFWGIDTAQKLGGLFW